MSHWIIIGIYALALCFILAYSLVQLYLVIQYKRSKKAIKNTVSETIEEDHSLSTIGRTRSSTLSANRQDSDPIHIGDSLTDWPPVTVQLPVYNEKYVVERLLESIASFDYPKDRLQIQLLDDSTDDSFELAAQKIEELKQRGFDIQHLHREDRKGYKAGALAEALPQAKAELIAIFDSDFLPPKDYLIKTVPAFQEEKLGMVQCKWGHVNRDFSWLTDLQAFGLDAHFSVEQGGRNAAGHFINFNGTAGIWRKACIVEAGGWSADTLTEDLDLSYRAQLKGWRFQFKEEVIAPAELPAEMNALRNQQYRWNKGAAECMRKNLPQVLRSGSLPLSTKVNAVFHLMNSSIFICVMLLAVLSLPMMWIKYRHPELDVMFNLAAIFLISLPILAYFYWISERNGPKRRKKRQFLLIFPAFLSVSMGLSLHNAIAVAEGYLGRKTAFVRTPKFNLSTNADRSWMKNIYLDRKLNPLVILELIFAIYFLFGILMAFQLEDFGLLPFHLMLFLGFSFVGFTSIKHSFNLRA